MINSVFCLLNAQETLAAVGDPAVTGAARDLRSIVQRARSTSFESLVSLSSLPTAIWR